MPAFLVQVSGHSIQKKADPKYVQGAKGPRFCDEPLLHGEYFNASPFWREEGYGRREAWETVGKGDEVLLYCTGSVKEHGACLSHLLRVGDVSVSDKDGARLTFSNKRELVPKIPYADVQREVDSGRFSDAMSYCGQEGFNITRIHKQDVNRVRDLTQMENDGTSTTDNDLRKSLQDIAEEYFSEVNGRE